MESHTSVLNPKHEFLLVYDYGTGGVWARVFAHSSQEISNLYPEVDIFEKRPEWMSDQQYEVASSQSFDFDEDPHPEWLLESNASR